MLSCTRKGSSPDNAGSVMLTNMPKIVANAPTAAPHQDAMPHVRFRLVAGQDVEQPKTATHYIEGVSMRHGTDHAAINVAICSKPFKTQERCLHERHQGHRSFLCGSKPITKKCKMTRASGKRHKYCMFFVLKKTRTHFLTLLDDVKARSCFY